MDSFNETWGLICDYCKTRISDVAYKTFFTRLAPVSLDFDNKTAVIKAPNEYHKKTMENFYDDLLSSAFENVFGTKINYKIYYENEPGEPGLPALEKRAQIADMQDFTFDNFVVGPSNKFAHAACVAVAEKPSVLYNPLFIYGNSGLGKTHLLSAIAAETRKRNPAANIVFVKGDEFTNELIESIRNGNTAAFRDKYRKADILLMDDIQFIAGKESTQEEFFHTFNTLYENHRQIILTSDRPPKEIETLEDRLKSRFESGLTTDIQPPDFETRIAIINRKAESLNIDIPYNVSEYIANRIKKNIRQLEGAVKKLNAKCLVEGKSPTVNTAQEAISDIINDDLPAPITVERIIEECARTYSVTAEDIISSKRKNDVSKARQVAAYVIRELTQLPMTNIGDALGGRDHSTIVYSLQQVEDKIKQDPLMRLTVNDIIKNIKDS